MVEDVLVDRNSGKILALNASGAAIWELLDGKRDATPLAEVLAQAASIPHSDARRDVDALLERLGAEGSSTPNGAEGRRSMWYQRGPSR